MTTRSKILTAVTIAHTVPASPGSKDQGPGSKELEGLPGAARLARRTAAADSWLAPRSRSSGRPRMSPPSPPPPPLQRSCPPSPPPRSSSPPPPRRSSPPPRSCPREQACPKSGWCQVIRQEPGEPGGEDLPLQVLGLLWKEPGDQRLAQPWS